MADVGEKSSRRLDAFRHLQRLGDAQVGRVRLMSQGIDHEQLHALDLAGDVVGHSAAIAQVGDQFETVASEKIAVGFRASVRHGEGSNSCFA